MVRRRRGSPLSRLRFAGGEHQPRPPAPSRDGGDRGSGAAPVRRRTRIRDRGQGRARALDGRVDAGRSHDELLHQRRCRRRRERGQAGALVYRPRQGGRPLPLLPRGDRRRRVAHRRPAPLAGRARGTGRRPPARSLPVPLPGRSPVRRGAAGARAALRARGRRGAARLRGRAQRHSRAERHWRTCRHHCARRARRRSARRSRARRARRVRRRRVRRRHARRRLSRLRRRPAPRGGPAVRGPRKRGRRRPRDGHRRQRRAGAAGRLPALDPRGVRPARHPSDPRRGDDGLRPHGALVRLRALGRRPPTS